MSGDAQATTTTTYDNSECGDNYYVHTVNWRGSSYMIEFAYSNDWQYNVGFMGDVSVRRFIYEDPILTIGCRDYTGKEPMKNISWQHTARAGKVLVNQYDHTAESNVCIVLNIDGDSRFDIERCYEITRSVCEELEKRKIAYEFFTNADLEGPLGNKFSWVEEGLGRRHFGTIMYGLGCSRCICRHPFGWLIEQCKKRRRVALSYIVITPELSADAKLRLNELQAIS